MSTLVLDRTLPTTAGCALDPLLPLIANLVHLNCHTIPQLWWLPETTQTSPHFRQERPRCSPRQLVRRRRPPHHPEEIRITDLP